MSRADLHPDDLHRVSRLDPVRRDGDPAGPERLATVRARVDRERSARGATDHAAPRPEAAGRARGPRRRAGVLVAAAAAAVLVPTGTGLLFPSSPVARSVAPAAVAADGTIDCGVGYGEALDPAAAGTRLLPSVLPDGTGYAQIRAEESGGEGWCGPASLAAVSTAPDGLVTGVLRVMGPFDARLDGGSLGDAVPETVAGQDGYLVPQDDPDLLFFRYFFTDPSGRSWIAEVDGYPVEQATALLAGLSTDPEDGTADLAAAPGAPALTVVHRRTHAPYSLSSRSQQWYVTLTDGSQVRVDQRYDDHRTPVTADVVVGARIDRVGAHDVVTWPGGPGGGDGRTDGTVQVRADLGGGATAYIDAPDRAQALALLGSLEPAAPDDLRITAYGSG